MAIEFFFQNYLLYHLLTVLWQLLMMWCLYLVDTMVFLHLNYILKIFRRTCALCFLLKHIVLSFDLVNGILMKRMLVGVFCHPVVPLWRVAPFVIHETLMLTKCPLQYLLRHLLIVMLPVKMSVAWNAQKVTCKRRCNWNAS